MVLLPLVYLAIVALAALGVFGYVAFVWPRLGAIHGEGPGKVLVYAGPPLAGLVLVTFMLRSMWPTRRQTLGGDPLAADVEPELHV
jgi:hypothetical protein